MKKELKVIEDFRKLNVWRRNDERAPHKPLLALWSIGRCLRGKDRLVQYQTVEKELTQLLVDFGPPRTSQKPYEPFWRMQKDGVWQVSDAGRLIENSRGGVSPTKLRELNIAAGFPSYLFDLFRDNKALALEVAHELIDSHFTDSLFNAVFEATIGNWALDKNLIKHDKVDYNVSDFLLSVQRRRKRNSKFRKQVLQSYGYRCAICRYSIEFPIMNWPALEAAHIKWHGYAGPDNISNGLSLCVLHHELFDWGAFTVQPHSFNVQVAEDLVHLEKNRWIGKYHGCRLPILAKKVSDRPAPEFLNWHVKNVYRGNGTF